MGRRSDVADGRPARPDVKAKQFAASAANGSSTYKGLYPQPIPDVCACARERFPDNIQKIYSYLLDPRNWACSGTDCV